MLVVNQFGFRVAGAGPKGSPGGLAAVEFEQGRGFIKTPAPASPRHSNQTEPLPEC